MRLQRRFTVSDLMMLAARGDERAVERNLHAYLRFLVLNGFVEVLARPAAGARVYRLRKDVGEVAPVVPRVWRQRNKAEGGGHGQLSAA